MNLQKNFDKIDLSSINEFIFSKQEEHLELEFKTINHSDFSHKDDKKNFAKALSGFANSNGGIIIWGVEAKKNENDVDCAQAKKPIKNVKQFLNKLNEFTGIAANPIVEGVIHKEILEDTDTGYIKTLVPYSDSGPHMAKLSEDRYYKRSGDSFYKMEHYDIEDMFGRRKKPILRLKYKFVDMQYLGENRIKVDIQLIIENLGRGSAKAPFLSLEKPSNWNFSEYGVDGDRNFGLPLIPENRNTFKGCKFGNSNDILIHPNTQLPVTNLRRIFSKGEEFPQMDGIKINYQVAAEDCILFSDILEIPGLEIHDYIKFSK